jgi:meiotically up-regulated gene 157 (Mug157) protein
MNTYSNTLDTTIGWHDDGQSVEDTELKRNVETNGNSNARGPQSFVVTGDINAEWLRDSTNQLLQYQPLASKDAAIFNLILGAINTQVEFVIKSPYCNAFQPPAQSGLRPMDNGQADTVHPGEYYKVPEIRG